MTDKGTQKQQSTSDLIERLVAFAEQLGGLVGTVQAKAEGWLDRSARTKEPSRRMGPPSSLLSGCGAVVSRSMGGSSGEKTRSRERFPSLTRRDAHALRSGRDLEQAQSLPSRASTDEFPSI